MDSLENLENHYDDFSTCRQDVKIWKISVKSHRHNDSEYLLSNAL